MEILHAHLFCGLGGGAKGFNQGSARVGSIEGRFRCLGGIDVDPASCRDFGDMAGVSATCLDLFDREQYVAFHGHEPPADWREATPQDLHRAFGPDRPNIIFTSAPCKGFSGLLPEARSITDRYQALNALTLRGPWLAMEAYSDDPPELLVFENVPRIMSRGRPLLDRITALLRHYGYAVAETVHDCGVIGGLAQTRKRFLLVARHIEKVPPFLYEPPHRALRGVGEVLEKFPVPGPEAVLPMHRLPSLQWKTWVRLAFVEAGGDWRSLNRLAVGADGMLSDYGIAPATNWHRGALGVHGWDEHTGTVTGRSMPTTGAHSVADPRIDGHPKSVQHGVRKWDQPSCVVTGKMLVGGGPHAVADPRAHGSFAGKGKYQVVPFEDPARTVIAGSTTGHGAFAVADPRPGNWQDGRKHFQGGGHYGVTRWDQTSMTVAASSRHDNGRWAVADPRDGAGDPLPAPDARLVACIRALDGTWHRPFTTLELAALQGLVEPDQVTGLDGESDTGWRERIGNAVPPPAARAIAGVMGRTLLLAWSGQSFALSNERIWVRPVAVALSVDQPGNPRL